MISVIKTDSYQGQSLPPELLHGIHVCLLLDGNELLPLANENPEPLELAKVEVVKNKMLHLVGVRLFWLDKLLLLLRIVANFFERQMVGGDVRLGLLLYFNQRL